VPPEPAPKPPAAAGGAPLTPGLDEMMRKGPEVGLFEDRWSLGRSGSEGRFDLRAHKPSYLLPFRYSNAPNRAPSSPTRSAAGTELDLRKQEAKFQISFKVRLADWDAPDVFGHGSDSRVSIWGAYTQQSQWQVYNGAVSRPFRETNYEPELIAAFDPDVVLASGWRWRLAALSLNHQSNGRDDPLSRSWNRVIAWLGVERGGLGIQLRAWQRLNESLSTDDNPDIGHYLGYGDALVSYQAGQHTFSVLGRRNLDTGRGALQFGWSFPLDRRLRGTLQLFSGYGESLIDYNVRQKTIGIGVLLTDWL
jgi:phospholipase A1